MDRPANKFGVLALLVVVYTLNFLDRQIVGILATPIKAELHLSDTQLGLLGGPAFALFYTLLGIPVAWAADRYNRTWIITAGLVLWSAFTAACGMAQSFSLLFLARMGVGVGEAGCVAPSYSLIADYFPRAERSRAFAGFSLGIPIGSALGIILGGLVASYFNWRIAFIGVGLAGLLVAPVFLRFTSEPQRGRFDGQSGPAKASIGKVFGTIVRKPSFWYMSFGASCCSIMNYGSFFWFPSFLLRSYHLPLREAAYLWGAIVFVGGIIGIWLGGVLADRFSRSTGALALIPAIALLIAAPGAALALFAPSLAVSCFLFVVPVATSLAYIGPTVAAVQGLVPASMRATASSFYLFINNLLGLGLGTILIGAISDSLRVRFGAEALRYSIFAGAGFYVIAAAFFFAAARTLARDWNDNSRA